MPDLRGDQVGVNVHLLLPNNTHIIIATETGQLDAKVTQLYTTGRLKGNSAMIATCTHAPQQEIACAAAKGLLPPTVAAPYRQPPALQPLLDNIVPPIPVDACTGAARLDDTLPVWSLGDHGDAICYKLRRDMQGWYPFSGDDCLLDFRHINDPGDVDHTVSPYWRTLLAESTPVASPILLFALLSHNHRSCPHSLLSVQAIITADAQANAMRDCKSSGSSPLHWPFRLYPISHTSLPVPVRSARITQSAHHQPSTAQRFVPRTHPSDRCPS
jgi:hypothetical protein